jgi:hypothetical protein
MRLNCLTIAYADLWSEVYDQAWRDDAWAAPTAADMRLLAQRLEQENPSWIVI